MIRRFPRTELKLIGIPSRDLNRDEVTVTYCVFRLVPWLELVRPPRRLLETRRHGFDT